MKKADKAYINGNIITMEAGLPHASEIATAGNRILHVGPERSVKKYIRPETEIIDLAQRTVLPGLIDNHVHFLTTCINMRIVDLKTCRSIAEILEKLRDRIQSAKPGEWIQGHGFDQAAFTDEPRLPTRWDLDKVSTEHPIIIKRVCMHLMVANSSALNEAQIQPHQMTNGKEGLTESGELNGILCEQDIDLLLNHMPHILETDAQKKAALIEGMQKAAGFGLTSIRPCHVEALNMPDPIRLYHELDVENRLPLRVCIDSDQMCIRQPENMIKSNKVKFGACKLFTDGALGARTAALSRPYSDRADSTGVLNYSQQALNDRVLHAYGQGIQTAIHAIGDLGIDMAVSAMENAVSRSGLKPDCRFRLVHGSLMRDDLISRLKRLPVVIDVQPTLMRQSIVWAEDRLGRDRSRYLYPFKTLVKAGFRLAGGSDSPGESMDPFLGIAYAVTRQNPVGLPDGGWNPNERLTVHEALSLYTVNAAYSSFEENEKGSLKPGKLADFVVIDKDLLNLSPEKISMIKVHATVCDGEFIFNKGIWDQVYC